MRRHDADACEVRAAGPPPLKAPAETVIEVLAPLITQKRLARLQNVAAARVAGVIPVLENFSDPHNAAAVMRSAEAFGIQRIQVIPGERGFFASRTVSMGTSRWVDIAFHGAPEPCLQNLHALGYTVFVASMEGDRCPEALAELERVAIVFGNERHGPSAAMRAGADGTYAIPMRGFVESLNVSVAAAITLHAATRGRPTLDPTAQRALLARFLLASVRDGERIVDEAQAKQR